MTVFEKQTEHIHSILMRMLAQEDGYFHIEYGSKEIGYEEAEAKYIQGRMELEGLAKTYNGPNENGLSVITTKGYQIASGADGYKGHIEARLREQIQQQEAQLAQQKREEEQLELNRTSAKAATRSADAADRSANASDKSADAAERSVKWAKVGVAIALAALLASIVAIVTS